MVGTDTPAPTRNWEKLDDLHPTLLLRWQWHGSLDDVRWVDTRVFAISTATYLTDIGAPTMVLSRRLNAMNGRYADDDVDVDYGDAPS